MISADIAKLPEQKKTKAQEEPEKARDKLLIQLESRVRSLEYGQGSQVFLQKSHHLASKGAEIYQKCLEVVKQEGKDHKRGPPELQIFAGLLADFDPWLSDSSSPPEVRKFSGVGARLQAMLQNEDEVAASEWIKDFSFSPTFDSNVVRLSFTLKGQVLIARNMPQAQKLAQEQASTFDVVRGSFTILPDLPSLSERAVAARTLRISCGRAKDNTVVIGDDTRISTLHFVISVCATPGGCVLLELTDQSSNGTWHNGQRMVRGRGVPMAVGDTVTVLPIDQVGRDSEVGFLLVRDVRGAWCSKCPVTSPASSPREGPPAEERGSPGREAPAEQVPRTLERDLHCGICRDALHQCLTVVPCGHNFCGVCLAKWRRTSSACPECRGSIVQAVRNQTVDRLVETFLCAHPDAARSQEDLAAMEAAARDPDHRYMMRWLVQPPALRPTAASVRAAPTPVRRQPQPAEQPARSGAAAPQPPLAEGQAPPPARRVAEFRPNSATRGADASAPTVPQRYPLGQRRPRLPKAREPKHPACGAGSPTTGGSGQHRAALAGCSGGPSTGGSGQHRAALAGCSGGPSTGGSGQHRAALAGCSGSQSVFAWFSVIFLSILRKLGA
ncbi:unnamed protein product [Prorocentrum cordatum]|uniref:E3 ubiquitin-protein ligase CHFR n=1 Tax=Prorocentrum cordatum TaxID=2364126 RepID=A0ABN9VS61_9DINO|nr:unnamed protein product [Polarella glacialis]